MNSRCLLLALFGVAAALPLSAAEVNRTPLQLVQTYEPPFPAAALAEGVNVGEVQVLVQVDATGKLGDWLIVAHSHEALATLTGRALREWEFRPATIDGQPVGAQALLTFHYRATGVVVSQHMTQHYLATIRGHERPRLTQVPRSLRELDRIPTPLATPAPRVAPAMVAASPTPETTVEFYIDEAGAVRMPVVVAGDEGELGVAALEAVRQWKFEPPTSRGRPVLVQASQQFLFAGAPVSPATVTAP